MQNSAISDMNATSAPYTQTGALKGDTTSSIAQAKSADETASTLAPPTGDSVSISQEARVAAEQKANGTTPDSPAAQETPPVKEPSYSPIKTVTTSDGTEVRFEASYTKDKKGYDQAASVRVNFTGKDGETYSHTLNESSILTQDENGRWQVSQIQGNNVAGSENDDIIILLPTGKPAAGVTESGVLVGNFSEDKTALNVDAGDGNNVVMDFSGETTTITTGNGNDTIVGSNRTGRFVVHSGAGDDDIELKGSSAYVYSGDGDDTLVFEDIAVMNAESGAGNDNIQLKGDSGVSKRGAINAGDGDDYIQFENGPSGTTIGGNGNDKITFNSSGSTAYIDGGEGNDIIKGKTTGGDYYIQGGNGDDSISLTGTGGNYYVSGGNDNDHIKLYKSGGNAHINGDNGEDTIIAGVNGGKTYINGGAGDDIIYAYSQGNVSDFATIVGGNGVDIILVHNNSNSIDQNEINKIVTEIKKQNNKQTQSEQEDIFDYDQYIADAAMGINKRFKPSKYIDNELTSQTPASTQHDYSQLRQALIAYSKHV